MNVARFSALRERVHALPEAPSWARAFVLRSGRHNAGRARENRPLRHE
jgi:hypothetical protein